jgi:hypothetical protein
MATIHGMNRRRERAAWRKHCERLKILAVAGHTVQTYPIATIALGTSADAFKPGDYITIHRRQG